MIELKNVSKFYYSKGIIATGFTRVNVKFNIGEFVAITGESGSGKSTLLNVISGLDTYEEGEMFVDGKETSHYLEKDWEIYRRKYIGNIYQNFNLINSYTVYQNIDIIMSLNGIKKNNRRQKIIELLEKVDMLKYKNTKVSKLSGGQKQRVAIARALAKDVPIIIADEPTGNLDKKSAESIIELLRKISEDKLIIIVTHNYEQVEEFVTRKITMHDGKILEDRKIKYIEKVGNVKSTPKFKNIPLYEQIKLGIRNTFNIVPKFLLLLLVYSFVICSLMSEYSTFKKGEYEASKTGYNYIIRNTDDHRIIINKKDKTSFTEEEIKKIKKLKNVENVIENDLLLDYEYQFSDIDELEWYSGFLKPTSFLKQKDISLGRLPENDNEIVLEGYEDDYYLKNADSILEKTYYFWNEYNSTVDKTTPYTVVGIKYLNENETNFANYGMTIYVSDNLLNQKLYISHQRYSVLTYDFINEIIKSNGYSSYNLVPNEWVEKGKIYISDQENYRCDKYNCINQNIKININNIYYQDELTLQVSKVYNSKNINKILKIDDYDSSRYYELYEGNLYVNKEDYDSLYNKGTYQMSIYVDKVEDLDKTVEALDNMNLNTLAIRDTITQSIYTKIVRIFKILVTIFLVVVLFFISYFIIKVILKSRNIYFSIIRMLGASKRICLHLLMIELLTVSNISYFIFILIAELNRNKYFNINFINTVNTYFKLNDYITLYMIIIIMSLLISLRYSRKLFKDSVMNTYREEI